MTIYVVGCKGSSRLVKIGWTVADPDARSAHLQVGSPYPLQVLWQSGPDHGPETEAKLHTLFKAYRMHGEWFDFGRANPVSLIAAAVDLPPLRPDRGVVRGSAQYRRHPQRAPVPLDNLLEDVNSVLSGVALPAAKVAAVLFGYRLDPPIYQGATGKSLVRSLAKLGVKVPSTGNRWLVHPDSIRAALADRTATPAAQQVD